MVTARRPGGARRAARIVTAMVPRRIRWGDLVIPVSPPISITLLAISVLVVVVPLVLRQMGKGRVLAQLAAAED